MSDTANSGVVLPFSIVLAVFGIVLAFVCYRLYTINTLSSTVDSLSAKLTKETSTRLGDLANVQVLISKSISDNNATMDSKTSAVLSSVRTKLLSDMQSALDATKQSAIDLIKTNAAGINADMLAKIKSLQDQIAAIQTLTTVLGDLQTSRDLFAKTIKTNTDQQASLSADLARLVDVVTTKADKVDLSSINKVLSGKADQADVDNMSRAIVSLSNDLSGNAQALKSSTEDSLAAVSTAVAAKANQSSIVLLQSGLDGAVAVSNDILSKLSAAKDAWAKQAGDLGDGVASVGALVKALQSSVSALQALSPTLATQSSVGLAVKGCMDAISLLQTSLSTSIGDNQVVIASLQSSLGDATAKLGVVSAALEGKVDVGVFNSSNSSLAQQISDLKSSITQVANTNALKANQVDLASLKSTLDVLSASISAKANQVDLAALILTVNNKADKADLVALKLLVDAKASQTDLAAFQQLLDKKANADDIASVLAAVSSKTNTSDFAALKTLVDLKLNTADLTSFKTTNQASLDLKANQADLTALQGVVTQINTKVATNTNALTVIYTPPTSGMTLVSGTEYTWAGSWNNGIPSDSVGSDLFGSWVPNYTISLENFRHLVFASLMKTNGSSPLPTTTGSISPIINIQFRSSVDISDGLGNKSMLPLFSYNSTPSRGSPFGALNAAMFPDAAVKGPEMYRPSGPANTFTASKVYKSSTYNLAGLTTSTYQDKVSAVATLWYLLNAAPSLSVRYQCNIELTVLFTMAGGNFIYVPPNTPTSLNFKASRDMSASGNPFIKVGVNAVLDANAGLIVPGQQTMGSTMVNMTQMMTSNIPAAVSMCPEQQYACGLSMAGNGTNNYIQTMCCAFNPVTK
jgi:hypothetical protein